MQPYIDTADRDFRQTKDGDLRMTFDIEEQNAVGVCRIHTGSDMFQLLHGIDWQFIATLGDKFDIKKYVASEIQEKFQDEGIAVDEVKFLTTSYPYFKFEVYYKDLRGDTQTQVLDINLL